MNRIQRNKLHLSKWTATEPTKSEKHFIVTRLIDEPGQELQVIMEAVHSGREFALPWTDLKDDASWLQGWR